MNNKEFSKQLLEIADGIDKIASSVEASQSEESEARQKTASSTSTAGDFGFGELGSKPNLGRDPLLDFCLS